MLLKEKASRECSTCELESNSKFLCLAAACAAIKHASASCACNYAAGTVAVTYSGSEGHMLVDLSAHLPVRAAIHGSFGAATATNLELVSNKRDGRRDCTLFSSINNTKTAAGGQHSLSSKGLMRGIPQPTS